MASVTRDVCVALIVYGKVRYEFGSVYATRKTEMQSNFDLNQTRMNAFLREFPCSTTDGVHSMAIVFPTSHSSFFCVFFLSSRRSVLMSAN